MFRSTLNRILDWAEGALAPIEEEWDAREGPSGAIEDDHEAAAPLPHPHRRELRWDRDRRPGAIPRAPAQCISPVRRKVAPRPRQDSAR